MNHPSCTKVAINELGLNNRDAGRLVEALSNHRRISADPTPENVMWVRGVWAAVNAPPVMLDERREELPEEEPELEPEEAPPKTTRHRLTILGHPVTAIIRYLAKEGFDYSRIRKIINRYGGTEVKDNTIKTSSYLGLRGEGILTLTAKERKELLS